MRRTLLLLLLTGICLGQQLTLLHTTDTHGACGVHEHAWLRLATLIRRELASRGKENCLLIDTGDAVQGSLMASLSRGVGPLTPLRVLPYDVCVPGNHELDFGIGSYLEFCRLLEGKLLSANFRIKGQNVPGWRMFRKSGLKVAVIGIQASYYANWLLPEDVSQCIVERGEAALERLLPEVCAAKPDLIVLAIHQGWTEPKADSRGVNEVARIAERFPEIDIILGGHTHRTFEGRKVGNRAWYLQPSPYGKSLGVAEIRFKKGKLEQVSSHLLSTEDDSLIDDPALAKALQPFWGVEEKELRRDTGIILKREISSAGRAGSGCQTSSLLCQAMAKATGAEIALHNKLNEYSLFPGKITPVNLFRLVPYENTIVTAEVTLPELEEILAEQNRFRKNYRFCEAWNVRHVTKNGKTRVVTIGENAPDAGGKRYRIALNSHTASGSGNFPVLKRILGKPESRMTDTGISVRTAVERFLKMYSPEIGK